MTNVTSVHTAPLTKHEDIAEGTMACRESLFHIASSLAERAAVVSLGVQRA